ncbi:ATP-binding protein [Virgisporangium aliadipatigenens]|nr:adenylate/guanylate cyclase domain-containing protein [Virgisporangium aliadipatigenens]
MRLPAGLVTFLFTDIEGSTRLAQLLGIRYRDMLSEHRRVLRAALAGGYELFSEGDSLFFAFPDPGAALAACAEAQRRLAAHEWSVPFPPQVRMGLHTGPARPYGGEYATAEVHRAARVAGSAHGGQVLCSSATAALAGELPSGISLRDLGLHRLRGFDSRERLFQLVGPGLVREFPRPRGTLVAPHNLPAALESFVGRAAEQRELARLVEERRLVTVVGPGGAGKTRLAVEVARRRVATCPDGVWFADLADVADPAGVERKVADALGLRPEPGRPLGDTIADYVAARRLLLVLDTCDTHPEAAAALATRVLGGGAGTVVLATGREPLHVPGEVVWRIPAMELGDATRLLAVRAAAARGDRAVPASELPDLTRVAARLDGLPLALELAGARMRLLPAAQVAKRLSDLLGLLDAGRAGTGRHSTMSASLEWSYRTLPPGPARLLRRLSVFHGPVELSTVEAVHGDDPLDPLAVLVDKCLLDRGWNGYRVPETVRGYAVRLLRQAGEENAARDRHVAWCRHTVRAAPPELYHLDPFADEVRAALDWTTSGGSARDGIALVDAFAQWWHERGLAREGRRWLHLVYERASATAEHIPDVEIAGAHRMYAAFVGAEGGYAEQLSFVRRAEELARRAGDPAELVRVLAARGAPLRDLGRDAEAERACREAIDVGRREGVPVEALPAVYCLAQLLWRQGAWDEAADVLAAARPWEQSRPADRARRTVDLLLGLVAVERGDVVAAHDHLLVTLRARMAHGFHAGVCETVAAFAVRCASGGQPLVAARLFGAAQAGRAALHLVPGAMGMYWSRRENDLRERLGDRAFDAAYAEGCALPLAEAVTSAMAVEHPDLVTDAPSWTPRRLDLSTRIL